jgi:hypothetical protein
VTVVAAEFPCQKNARHAAMLAQPAATTCARPAKRSAPGRALLAMSNILTNEGFLRTFM